MRIVVSAFVILCLLLAVGCDNNDDNSVEPIDKFHYVYPVFHFDFDNSYQKFAVDSLQMAVTPSVGWFDSIPVYTDENGFIGTLGAGTYIISIDTTVEEGDTAIDTNGVNFGFSPAESYEFSFSRTEAFEWLDSLRTDYATTIDSAWTVLDAETLFVSKVPDPAVDPVKIIDSVMVITDPADTVGNSPESTVVQEILYGYWFDERHVIADPNDTAGLPPDSTELDTLLWGFWSSYDTFYLTADSSYWCGVVETIVIDSQWEDINHFIMHMVDTFYEYSSCEIYIDSTRNKIYNTWGWGDYDTTYYFTFTDTTKGMVFTSSGVLLYTWIVQEDSSVVSDTTEAAIYLIHDGVVTELDNLTIPLTMPETEVFPDYEIYFKNPADPAPGK